MNYDQNLLNLFNSTGLAIIREASFLTGGGSVVSEHHLIMAMYELGPISLDVSFAANRINKDSVLAAAEQGIRDLTQIAGDQLSLDSSAVELIGSAARLAANQNRHLINSLDLLFALEAKLIKSRHRMSLPRVFCRDLYNAVESLVKWNHIKNSGVGNG